MKHVRHDGTCVNFLFNRDANSQLALKCSLGSLPFLENYESHSSFVNNDDIALRIAYFRKGGKIYELFITATEEEKVFLFLNLRRGKDGVGHLPDGITCYQDNSDQVSFITETVFTLRCLRRYQETQKSVLWKRRLHLNVQVFEDIRKRKLSNSRSNVAVVETTLVSTIAGQSDAPNKKARRDSSFQTSSHLGIKKLLPKTKVQMQDDIDSLLNTNKYSEFFQESVSHQKLASAIRAIPDLITNFVQEGNRVVESPEHLSLLTGLIADRFFSHCGWSLLEPEPIRGSRFSNVAVDIDQVTLELTNLSVPAIRAEELRLLTALRVKDHQIMKEVFCHEISPVMFPLNFRKLCQTLQRVKGGHSYMKPSDRKMYRSILCPTKGDVLKCSVAFHRGSNSKGKPTKRFSNDKDFQRMEKFLREKFFPDSEERWDKKTIDQKIIIAIYLTCQYLANCDGHAQDVLGFHTFFYATTESTIQVRNGLRFPFLFPFCLALLEQDMGSGSVSVVYETYGTKSRASVNIFDSSPASITRAAQELFAMNKTFSTGYLWRFARLVNSQQYCSQPHLVIGYGCNFRVSDEENRFQYAVVNTESLPDRNPSDETKKSRESCTDELEYLDPTLESQIQLDPVGTDGLNEEKIGEEVEEEEEVEELESDDITQTTPTPASALLQASKAVHYSVLGRTLPLSLQPSTRTGKGVRYQQYSVNLRQALGEYNQAVRVSALASDILKCISDYGSNKIEINFGLYYERVKTFRNLVSENMTLMKELGNITRLEVAMSAIPINIEHEISHGITYCYSLCRDNVTIYDASDIADIAEFFAQALHFRAFVASELVGNKGINVSSTDMAVYRVIPEINAYIRNFYSGRKSSGDRDIYGKRLGHIFKRPILETLLDDYSPLLKKIGILDSDFLWVKFLGRVSVSLTDDHKRFGRTRFERFKIRDRLVCPHCLRIFLADDINTDAHPCIEGKKDYPKKLLSPKDATITGKVSELMKQLTKEQKEFIDDILDSTGTEDQFNVNLIGVAGAGKSFTVNVLIHKLLYKYEGQAKLDVLCLTKSASALLNGRTIHSFFGLSHEDEDDFNTNDSDVFRMSFAYKCVRNLDNSKWIAKVKDPISALETLIIDECSMISACGLANIDYMLRVVRGVMKPFGGVRVILVGDPLQLSPIFEGPSPPTRFYFQSKAFTDEESNFMVYYFDKSIRQKDEEFITLLNKVRIGDINEDDINKINNTWGTNVPRDAVETVLAAEREYNQRDKEKRPSKYHKETTHYNCLDRFSDSFLVEDKRTLVDRDFDVSDNFVICAENEEVKLINSAFDKLALERTGRNGKRHFKMVAVDHFSYAEDRKLDLLHELDEESRKEMIRKVEMATRLPTELWLYEGKIVKFTKNNVGTYIANNMRGKIISIDEISQRIIVRPICHDEHLVAPDVCIQPYEESYEFECQVLSKLITVRRRQYPLESATAATIHVAEGLTCLLKQILIVGNHRFQHAGSAYVALSRARTPEQVVTLFPLRREDIIVDDIAKEFDEYHRQCFKRKVNYHYVGTERWLNYSDMFVDDVLES